MVWVSKKRRGWRLRRSIEPKREKELLKKLRKEKSIDIQNYMGHFPSLCIMDPTRTQRWNWGFSLLSRGNFKVWVYMQRWAGRQLWADILGNLKTRLGWDFTHLMWHSLLNLIHGSKYMIRDLRKPPMFTHLSFRHKTKYKTPNVSRVEPDLSYLWTIKTYKSSRELKSFMNVQSY